MWQESQKDREEALERRTLRVANEDGIRGEHAEKERLEDCTAMGGKGGRERVKE
jgi:hypothetical protein